jgi:hypothetical protein
MRNAWRYPAFGPMTRGQLQFGAAFRNGDRS